MIKNIFSRSSKIKTTQKSEALFNSPIVNNFYVYRYDIFAITLMFIFIIWLVMPILRSGHIVFSDMAFPMSSKLYMSEIFGVWNAHWSTSTMLNMPRLLYIALPYLLSALFGYSGAVLIKSFILMILLVSSLSMYLFAKRLVGMYISVHFSFFRIAPLIIVGVFYAVNPWVIMRIQHIYLLCGYSLFPLIIMHFCNIFLPRSQQQIIYEYYIFRVGPYKRNILDMVLLSLLLTVAAASIHYFFYSIIYLSVLGVLFYIRYGFSFRKYGKRNLGKLFKNYMIKVLILVLIFMLFSFYWFSVYFGSILLNAQATQGNVNVLDTFSLFSKNSSLVNVSYLISYWWPMFDLETLPLSFYVGGAVILAVVLIGLVFRAYKHHLVLFFSLLTVLLMVFSTGVYYTPLAKWFLLINKLPIIGFLFRDPNKIVGLLIVNVCILIVFGMEHIFEKINDDPFGWGIKLSLLVAVVLGYWFYLAPFEKAFIDGFYHPVEIPEEYGEYNEALVALGSDRVLYIPVSDNMIQNSIGVATPNWNKNHNEAGMAKATGDFHVYSSEGATIFHHEGNKGSIGYYMNYLQHLLDTGRTHFLNQYVVGIGADQVAYHDEYVGHEGRQDFNRAMIEMQPGLEKRYQDRIFDLYKILNPLEHMSLTSERIFTPYGWSHLEGIYRLDGFDYRNQSVLFTSLDKREYLRYVDQGDVIEARTFNDIFLSTLPERYYIKPFDSINEGNPFLKWSKSFLRTNDWKWYMQSQGIDNFPYDFDNEDGVAVTFASSKLDVPPYMLDEIHGKVVMDFDSMLRLDKFFVPDNPQIFSIAANPITETNEFPIVHGSIMRGDPKDIWQVAKSGLLDAKEDNPYMFNVKVSGRGADQLHIKVRFFDEDMEELGVSYVVAPDEHVDFDGVHFYGEYISPKDARFMRMDLLSFNRPEQKVYWWIHDIEFVDLFEYKARNEIKLNTEFNESVAVEVFMRALVSRKGGSLKVTLGEESVVVDTFNKNLSQFQWYELGQYNLDGTESEILMDNIDGFNAINQIVVIPLDELEKLKFPALRALDKANVFMYLEAENDFEYEGNIQSKRVYPQLSYGKGVSSQIGELSRSFEAFKNGDYSMKLAFDIPEGHGGNLKIRVVNGRGEVVYYKRIDSASKSGGNDLMEDQGVEYPVIIQNGSAEDGYDLRIMNLEDTMSNGMELMLKGISLERGEYRLTVDFDSAVPSVTDLRDFHKFQPEEIAVPAFLADAFQEDCSDCESITFDMMSYEVLGTVGKFTFEPTCSCDWYVFSSSKSEVEAYEEYLFNVDARSKGIRKRHMKVLFLDDYDHVVKVQYINDVDEIYKNDWNRYEQLIEVPERATKMMFQIWARGGKEGVGDMEIRNYSIIPYKELITVDSIALFEGNRPERFLFAGNSVNGEDSEDKERVIYIKSDAMKKDIELENLSAERYLLNVVESPNPLWTMSLTGVRGDLAVNGTTMGYIIEENGKGSIQIIFRGIYLLGLVFLGLGLPISVLIYLNIERINYWFRCIFCNCRR